MVGGIGFRLGQGKWFAQIRRLFGREQENYRAAQQQPRARVGQRQLAEILVAQLQVQLADALFERLILGRGDQFIFVLLELGRFQGIVRLGQDVKKNQRPADHQAKQRGNLPRRGGRAIAGIDLPFAGLNGGLRWGGRGHRIIVSFLSPLEHIGRRYA